MQIEQALHRRQPTSKELRAIMPKVSPVAPHPYLQFALHVPTGCDVDDVSAQQHVRACLHTTAWLAMCSCCWPWQPARCMLVCVDIVWLAL